MTACSVLQYICVLIYLCGISTPEKVDFAQGSNYLLTKRAYLLVAIMTKTCLSIFCPSVLASIEGFPSVMQWVE